MVARKALPFLFLLGVTGANPAWAEEPLSAIGWLSQSVIVPVSAPQVTDTAVIGAVASSPIARDALSDDITVLPLGQASLDAVGLLPPGKTGLPRDLWGPGRTDDILSHVSRLSPASLPALQSLFLTLLLAETEPPADAGASGRLLIGRIDKLLGLGALDQAMAILQAAGDTGRADLFQRSFDVALLTGSEDRACRKMLQSPGLSPALPARIFCLARGGDWTTAAVTLQTAVALGQIDERAAAPLLRFMEIETSDVPLPAPQPVTPLDLRIFEAIGESLPIQGLPLAFAHSDLDNRTGWKARLEAAERLSRAGVIGPNLLLGYYTMQKPAASGGVWDRVRAFQTFEMALGQGDTATISLALPAAYQAMQQAGLEVAFADLFAGRLADLPMTAQAADLGLQLALLSAEYADLIEGRTSTVPRLAFALALSRGEVTAISTLDPLERAIAAAWEEPDLPADLVEMADQGRSGELALTAIERVLGGLQGQLTDFTTGIAALRTLGLEDAARRVALQVLLLDRKE